MNDTLPVRALRQFLSLEAAGGILLIAAAILALLAANSPLASHYEALFDLRLAVLVGDLLALDKPLLLWVNDGLMAVFFLLIGLEVKRELLEGELSNREQMLLPLAGAAGGFVLPAAIYAAVNWHDPSALNGWAIPAATDIAFALGVLGLLGGRVPAALKVFLASLAIFDDLGAIVVIALFYTSGLSAWSLVAAAACIVVLIAMNRFGVTSKAAYLLVGSVMWVCVLKSGVHATLAGIVVAMTIPLRDARKGTAPLSELEHSLHPWAAFFILPLFAFANAGVSFQGVGIETFLGSVSLGAFLGLFIGKQLGVFAAVFAVIKLGFAKLPAGSSWLSLYGVCVLTGIGFTMSLFIGSLAFERGDFDFNTATRIGVLVGSTLAAVVGYVLLERALPRSETPP